MHNTSQLSTSLAEATDWLSALQQRLQGEVLADRFSRAMYATDASVYQILPAAVVRPCNAADVVETVRFCREQGLAITARGGGTSQAGQAIGAGISLDFSRHMNRILDLDIAKQTVTVEPGIVLAELNQALKPHGLQLPLDLSTANRATIGGMIANNSAGTRSIIYGKTLDYVEALQVVLSDGAVVWTGPLAADELVAKLGRTDLEGQLYRIVNELGKRHAGEIERRYPRILRRVGGYNLDEFTPARLAEHPFDLGRVLVGSEGTLGLTLQAKLRLVPLPQTRAVCCLQFADVLTALRATPTILGFEPSAIELVDRFILDTTKGRVEFEPLRDFIVGDPGAVLIVEFMGAEAAARVEALAAAGLGEYLYRASSAAEQAKIWELRRAALGLTMSKKGGDAKGISFIEDTAVAPEYLAEYIEKLQGILAKYETEAGFYAHASVGLLHIRPVINLKFSTGVERFAAIADEVADLVLAYGGALSGEHGDGLVRAPFQERMFGSILYQAFCQLKVAFDPDNLFNPGKIVHAPPLTDNLRFGVSYKTPEYDTAFAFDDYGGLLRATEQCSGVGACRQTVGGTMCPSYMATREEKDSTRGRANSLRLALNGQLSELGLADPELREVMALCLECKACASECPTGVDMARLKSEFQYQFRQRHDGSWRERLLGEMATLSRWGSRLAPLSNWLAAPAPSRRFLAGLLGLDARRPLPRFARRSFVAGWRPKAGAKEADRPIVALFADTFNNYYEPDNLQAAAQLLQAAGAHVQLAPQVCCGRPLISKGFLDEAAHQATVMTRALLPLIEAGIPVLFSEPSCHSAVLDDHPRLLRGMARAEARQVAAGAQLLEGWLAENGTQLQFASGPARLLVHGHCHQKALVGMEPLRKLLQHLPGTTVELLDSGCCGQAGLFGYEQYDISRAIGERRLLPAARALSEEEYLIAPGFSCRHQVDHFTGIQPLAPAQLLARYLRH